VSTYTEHTPLSVVEGFEAAAFRLTQVARQLLAEHPGLPINDIRPSVLASTHGISAQLEISVYDEGTGVRAWAEALGAAVTIDVHDVGTYAYEHHEATVERGGVTVHVGGTRRLTDEEFATLRAKGGEVR
jgi:hypothetical protein